jgi:hypothetical protein
MVEISSHIEISPAPEGGGTPVRRRPRKLVGASKYMSKVYNNVFEYGIPAARYGIVPAMITYVLFCTEPAPSVMELLNPFF